MLYSNTKLKMQFTFIVNIGFVEVPLEKNSPYKQSNIKLKTN